MLTLNQIKEEIRDNKDLAKSLEKLVYVFVENKKLKIEKNELELDFKILIENSIIEEKAAIYFFKSCGEYIQLDGRILSENEISNLKEKHKDSISKAEISRYHNSSDDNPYP